MTLKSQIMQFHYFTNTKSHYVKLKLQSVSHLSKITMTITVPVLQTKKLKLVISPITHIYDCINNTKYGTNKILIQKLQT